MEDVPEFVRERYRIQESLGRTCIDGGLHELRMHYTNGTLLFAILVIPYLCGYRGRRVCVCKKCKQKFDTIVLPEP
ncbi:hypothetical protein CLU79DRAFT_833748 [Phycomyces nitens]|nr:hypothetical protein CLU79DRAFT_833748 [Phycomyces nitens]